MEEHQDPNVEAKKTGGGIRDSIQKLKEKFIPGVKYTLLLSLVVNFSMLVVGCTVVHKCPVNTNIPLFLIAIGAIGIMSKFISYTRDRIVRHFQIKYFESALYTVETVFFFLGSYWVYKEFRPSFNPEDGVKYCDKTGYMFAFIYLTVLYSLILVMLMGFLCFLCCACILAGSGVSVPVDDVESQIDHSQNSTQTRQLNENTDRS